MILWKRQPAAKKSSWLPTTLLSFLVVGFILPFVNMPLAPAAQANYSLSAAEENKLMHFQINPGSQSTGYVTLTNTSRQIHEIKLQALDGAKTNSGGFAVSQADEPQKNIGAWTTLKSPRVSLQGREKKLLAFTITIPNGTAPGTYAGGIIAEEVSAKKEGTIMTTIRSVVPLYVIVPGKVPIKRNGDNTQMPTTKLTSSLKWNAFTHTFENNKHLFTLELANTGETALAVTTNITIESLWGLQKTALPTKEIFLYKDEKITLRLPGENMPSGSFTATANVTYAEKDLINNEQKSLDQFSKKIEFSSGLPYSTIAIICVVIALIVLIVVRLKPLQR